MRFKADENLPLEVAELFRQAGHDMHTVLEEAIEQTTQSVTAERVIF